MEMLPMSSLNLSDFDEQTYILLFVGYHYASDPEQLTIVVLRNDKATLVFNKHWSIYNLRESPFLMKVVATSFHASCNDAKYGV